MSCCVLTGTAADDDVILQEMSERRRFLPQLSTAVQRGWVYRYGRMLRNL